MFSDALCIPIERTMTFLNAFCSAKLGYSVTSLDAKKGRKGRRRIERSIEWWLRANGLIWARIAEPYFASHLASHLGTILV